jgi:hypothetical protein
MGKRYPATYHVFVAYEADATIPTKRVTSGVNGLFLTMKAYNTKGK